MAKARTIYKIFVRYPEHTALWLRRFRADDGYPDDFTNLAAARKALKKAKDEEKMHRTAGMNKEYYAEFKLMKRIISQWEEVI